MSATKPRTIKTRHATVVVYEHKTPKKSAAKKKPAKRRSAKKTAKRRARRSSSGL